MGDSSLLNAPVCRLDEVATLYSGGTPSRGRLDYFGGSIPWVKSGEVNRHVITYTEEFLTEEGLKASSAKWAPKGAILAAMYGATAGKIARLAIDATINQAILAIIPNTEIVESSYLFHSLQRAVQGMFGKLQGSGQPNLNGSIFAETRLVIPSKVVQRRIASTLDSIDDVISAISSIIEQLRRVRKSLLADLLNRGLPGRPKTKFHTVRMSEIFADRKEPGLPGLPLVSVTMNDGLVRRDSVDRRVESALTAERHLLARKGDVAYNTMRMWQGVSGIAVEDCLVSPAYVVCRPLDGIVPEYAAYLLKHPSVIRKLHQRSQGVADDRLRLYFEHFAPIKVAIPPVDVQRRIAACLAQIDEEARTAERSLEATLRVQEIVRDKLLSPRGIPTGRMAISRAKQRKDS
ncbi:restriction endonuclease subunit S [bacterium]|nr:restriction endonuclease subunit S [bacterium]